MEFDMFNDSSNVNNTTPFPFETRAANYGELFFAYATPVIFVIGIIGNTLSFVIFLSKNLRKMSASKYLAMLSASDLCTLLFYVLSEWLRRGITIISPTSRVTFFDRPGMCQIWLFLNYTSRLISAWLIVAFTAERFKAVVMPLRRRYYGFHKETSRMICGVCIASCALAVYKPIMSDVNIHGHVPLCASKQSLTFESFILDSIYAIMITLLPFLIITCLNTLIVLKIIKRKRYSVNNFITAECHIRLDFTFILLAISFFFVAFNVPFFVVWVRQFIHTTMLSKNYDDYDLEEEVTWAYWREILLVTRTIFYMNYCINFFLYSVTAACFRREFKALFLRSRERNSSSVQEFKLTRAAVCKTHETLMKHSPSLV